MRLGRQSGETLIELMVGITVAGIILGSLAGLLYTVNDRFEHWGARLDSATDGFSLANALQADSHRYYPCGSGSGPQLQLCVPTSGCTRAVFYDSHAQGGTWVITRSEVDTGRTALVGRTRVGNQPQFTAGAGVIQVSNINDSLQLVVYYHEPVHLC